jgi:hypothetical protein
MSSCKFLLARVLILLTFAPPGRPSDTLLIPSVDTLGCEIEIFLPGSLKDHAGQSTCLSTVFSRISTESPQTECMPFQPAYLSWKADDSQRGYYA